MTKYQAPYDYKKHKTYVQNLCDKKNFQHAKPSTPPMKEIFSTKSTKSERFTTEIIKDNVVL